MEFREFLRAFVEESQSSRIMQESLTQLKNQCRQIYNQDYIEVFQAEYLIDEAADDKVKSKKRPR